MNRWLCLAACLILCLQTAVVVCSTSPEAELGLSALQERCTNEFGHRHPRQWGERLPGIKTRLADSNRTLAITLDACGGPAGSGVDSRLLAYLEQERIPATLFINGRWIDANRELFLRLAANPLFEIANHGLLHRPASVDGRSIYGIQGTRSVAQLVEEIEANARKIASLTGRRPRFYRSGTAYYDELAVQIAQLLGQQVAGFSLLGDAGATFSSDQVRDALLTANGGEIALLHMNHPESGTALGVMAAIPQLKHRHFRFVRLSDLELQ